ncbi:hypothetical protein [Pseudomonas sp. B21-048]|uniref:hypothetical protein n=1 Tax=Pseudomonas sp. B21-048 TaxID=2895490 RepID=UPI00215F60BF|nr:hypothetical protein [Pseudomonas sp. B21-048]UVK96612.1 hypothetical protein LOY56_14455 [Pseudomonas sp. B21-048]
MLNVPSRLLCSVISVFGRMFEHSWQALIFFEGKPTLRYLHARVNTLRKAP